MDIELRNISKHYLKKTALDNVSVSFASGKIHALLGENGAGKSTLAGIISGRIIASEGEILLDSEKTRITRQKDSLERGIAIVEQRPSLALSLSAYENIMLTRSGKSFFISPRIPQEILDLQREYAPGLDLSKKVKDLGGNNRFYISLILALLTNPKVLILDEPSAFLDMDERKKLYTKLRLLAGKNINIIVITHSTAEACTYPDTVTVLKKGKFFKSFGSKEEYAESLEQNHENPDHASKKENYPVRTDSEKKSLTAEPAHMHCPCFILSHASSKPKNRPILIDADLTVNYGEITAVSGLKEAALDTLEDLCTGIENSYSRGKAFFYDADGSCKDISISKGQLTSRFLRKNGCSIISSDRTFRASNPGLTVEQMLTAFDGTKNTTALAQKLIDETQVNITPEDLCSSLSGGMQQRLIITREFSTDPKLLILCNPMQGLDVESQGKLAAKINAHAQKGKAVLIIGSADFPLSTCARVYELESGKTKLVFEKGK